VKAGGTLVLNLRQAGAHYPASFLGLDREGGPAAAVQGPARSPAGGAAVELPDAYDCERGRLRGAAPLLEDAAGNVLACLNAYGKGRVLVTTVDYLIPKEEISSAAGRRFPLVEFLMDRIVRDVLPLEVKGDVEYGLNKLGDGWLLYLINNRGVTKYANAAQRLDPAQTARVEVFFKGIRPEGLVEVRSGTAIPYNQADNTFSVNVPPGGIRIVKISQ